MDETEKELFYNIETADVDDKNHDTTKTSDRVLSLGFESTSFALCLVPFPQGGGVPDTMMDRNKSDTAGKRVS